MLWEGDEGQGGGIWRGELFVENLVCSGVLEILLSRYSVGGASSGSQRREVLGLITVRPRYVSQREIKKVVGLT